MLPIIKRYYDAKWKDLKASYARCTKCMDDAPYEYCCKNYCGERRWCKNCKAKCRTTIRLCKK